MIFEVLQTYLNIVIGLKMIFEILQTYKLFLK